MKHHMIPLAQRASDFFASLDDIGFDVGRRHVSLLNLGQILFTLIVLLVAVRVVNRLARHFFRRLTKLDPAQRVLAEKVVALAVWTLAFLVGIDTLGISLTAFAVFSGTFGLAVGFGLQKTVGNLFAGLILLMDRSIKPGDVVAINDGHATTHGVVRQIGIRAVSVATLDNREFLIPNEILMTSQVENWSFSSREVGVTITLTVSFASDLAQVEALMLDAARSVERVLAEPEPSVQVLALGPNGIDMQLFVWINDAANGIGGLRSDLFKAVWQRFGAHGIEVPYGQVDVHLHRVGAEAGA